MNGDSSNQLRTNLTELHYSQLFFSIGHVAIKMLTFIEQMENDLKKAVADSYNAKQKTGEEGEDEDNDLAQITGGKDAEIDQYTQMLANIMEEKLIQEGLLGKFLLPIQNIAIEANKRYSRKKNGSKS